MNRQEAISQLKYCTYDKIEQISKYDKEALDMAISDMRKMSYLTDRPCSACKFNEDGNGCKKWTCAFEDDGKENE